MSVSDMVFSFVSTDAFLVIFELGLPMCSPKPMTADGRKIENH